MSESFWVSPLNSPVPPPTFSMVGISSINSSSYSANLSFASAITCSSSNISALCSAQGSGAISKSSPTQVPSSHDFALLKYHWNHPISSFNSFVPIIDCAFISWFNISILATVSFMICSVSALDSFMRSLAASLVILAFSCTASISLFIASILQLAASILFAASSPTMSIIILLASSSCAIYCSRFSDSRDSSCIALISDSRFLANSSIFFAFLSYPSASLY